MGLSLDSAVSERRGHKEGLSAETLSAAADGEPILPREPDDYDEQNSARDGEPWFWNDSLYVDEGEPVRITLLQEAGYASRSRSARCFSL